MGRQKEEMYTELMKQALQARKLSYAPYSHFAVGAALLTSDGEIFRGCNIENAAYSPGNCAERTAFFTAVAEGKRSFEAIAIAGGKAHGQPEAACPPCGMCRQVMMEFCDPESFEIIIGTGENEYEIFLLKDLFPMGFGPSALS